MALEVFSGLVVRIVAHPSYGMFWNSRTTFWQAAWGSVSGRVEALPLLKEATRRDPNHPYFRLQAGFAYGMLAANVATVKGLLPRYSERRNSRPTKPLDGAFAAQRLAAIGAE